MLRKEFTQVFRDKRMVMMMFGSPVLMLLLFGYAVNTDVTGIKAAVLDEDRSGMSREFIREFTGGGYFTVTAAEGSSDEMTALLDRGEADMFLHIQKGFAAGIRSGGGSRVQLIVDGSDSSRAGVILSYVNRITGNFSEEKFIDRVRIVALSRQGGGLSAVKGIEIRERALFNPELASRNFYLPGVLGLLIALITIMLTSMSVVKERESGTMEQIVVSPIRPSEFIAGKTLPFAIVSFAVICVIALITIFWFKVPFNGSFLFLMVSSLLFILASLAVGLFISTVSSTQQQAMLSSFLFFLPAILFSGFVFPIYSMPEAVQAVTFLNPLRYFIVIVRGVFLKGTGIVYLWPELAGLAVLGGTLFALSARRLSRRME
jgi:ABC-2 type transport system permease protein